MKTLQDNLEKRITVRTRLFVCILYYMFVCASYDMYSRLCLMICIQVFVLYQNKGPSNSSYEKILQSFGFKASSQ